MFFCKRIFLFLVTLFVSIFAAIHLHPVSLFERKDRIQFLKSSPRLVIDFHVRFLSCVVQLLFLFCHVALPVLRRLFFQQKGTYTIVIISRLKPLACESSLKRLTTNAGQEKKNHLVYDVHLVQQDS